MLPKNAPKVALPPPPAAASSESSSVARRERLRWLLSQTANSRCCDCKDLKPTWATIVVPPSVAPQNSPTIGAFCCLHCSAAHRKLGNHICHVRSVNLDDWTEDEVLAMERGGNLRLNAIFEGSLMFTDTVKPTPLVDASVRESFIRDKYEILEFFVANGYHCIGTEDEDEDDDIIDDDDDNQTSIISVLPLNLQQNHQSTHNTAFVAAKSDSSSLARHFMSRTNHRNSMATTTSRPSEMKRQASMPTIRSPNYSIQCDDATDIHSKSYSTNMDFWESMSNSAWVDLTFEQSLHQKSTIDLTTKSNPDSWNLSPHHPPDDVQTYSFGKGETIEVEPGKTSGPLEKRKCRRNGMTRPKSERLLRPSSSYARSSSSMERKRGKRDKYTSAHHQILDDEKKEESTHTLIPYPQESWNNKPGSSSPLSSTCIVPQVTDILSQLELENLIRLSKERDGQQPGSSKPIPRRPRLERMNSKTLSRRELVDKKSRSNSTGGNPIARRCKNDSLAEDMIALTGRKNVESHSPKSPEVKHRKSWGTSTKSARRHTREVSPNSRKFTPNDEPTPSQGAGKSGTDSSSKPSRTGRTSRSPIRPSKPSSLSSLKEIPRSHTVTPHFGLAHQFRSTSWDNVRSRKARRVIDSVSGKPDPSMGPQNIVPMQHERRSPSPRLRRHNRNSTSPALKARRTKSNRSLNASTEWPLADCKQALETNKFSLEKPSGSDTMVPHLKKVHSLDTMSKCKARGLYG